MADTVSSLTIADTSGVKFTTKLTNFSDGTGETDVTKVDASALTFMTEDGNRKISKLYWSINTSDSKSAVELVTQSYRALFKKQNKPFSIASARAGNVIGGGDWSENRLIPDIIRSLISDISIEVRNPNSIRPWQHVLEPLAGYLCLAKSMSTNGMYDEAFNFGPELDGNRTVEEVVKSAVSFWPGEYHLNINNFAHYEANLLKLSIDKAQSKLNWYPKWSFDLAIEKTMEWYKSIHEGVSPISITKSQIELYEKSWI